MLMLKGRKRIYNDIGVPGARDFGVGLCSLATWPDDMYNQPGCHVPGHDNYGNYRFQDGSVLVYVPKFYYRIGHIDNPTYATYGLNSVDIKSVHDFADTAAANAAGYALHRVFTNAGVEQPGVFIDKYLCSQNSYGGETIASSLKNGNPISAHADHNPIASLTACSVNQLYEAFAAAKGRGSIFHPNSRFGRSVLALISLAHGQAATATTYCAWYDAAGVINFPKGCNNNALGDTNDATVSYTSDGYSNCGKTGSGTPFAKTTHNGQACGVADINGLMWEVSAGLVRDTGNANFYVLKEAADINALTGGSGGATDAWGTDAQLTDRYDVITLDIANLSAWGNKWGNLTNQVLDAALTGDGWLRTGLAVPKDADARSAAGTNLFGQDGIYERHIASLCLLSGGDWGNASVAGPWAAYFSDHRANSLHHSGVRLACYPKPLS